MGNIVTGKNACPGFKKSSGSGGDAVGNGEEIAAFIAIENFLVDDAVLCHTAIESVTIGKVFAVYIDIRLDDVAGTDFKLTFQFASHFYNGHHCFVTGDHRIFFQVFGVYAGMFFTGTDKFHIGKAKSDGVDLYKKFIIFDLGKGQYGRLVVLTEIFKICSEKLPCENLFRQFILFHFFLLLF